MLAAALLQVVAAADPENPFAALSLVGAPAILTNACSLLVMSTGNRLARAVDLARTVASELEGTPAGTDDADVRRRLRELDAADRRGILLLRALRAVYAATGGFASATLVSLLGVVFARTLDVTALRVLEVTALGAGLVGVGGILWAATLLVAETRVAMAVLGERVAAQRARFRAT